MSDSVLCICLLIAAVLFYGEPNLVETFRDRMACEQHNSPRAEGE